MKICLLSYRGNPYCGGQGVYLYYLSKTLADRGHKVYVLAGPPYPLPMPWAELVKIPDHNFINKPGRSAIPAENPLSAIEPINLAELFLSKIGSNPEMLAFSIRSFQVIRKMLKQGKKIDLVHDNQSLGYGLLLVRRLGLPVIATIHHPLQIDRKEDLRQMPEFLKRLRRTLYYPLLMQKLVARRLDRIITVSETSKKLIAAAYAIPEGKIATIPNGVDLKIFQPDPGAKKIPGRLLFVGSSEDRKKGILYLLRALKRIADPKVHLVIVDGRLRPERVYAKSLVQKMGLSGRVEFREKISREDLILEYNRTQAVIVPSLFEGFGLPALEAMAMGAPLISTRVGALVEVTGAGEDAAAVLVQPGDDRGLADAIRNLLADSSLRERIVGKARSRAQALFSWESVGEGLEKIYQEEIARRE